MTCPRWADDGERATAFIEQAEALAAEVATDATPLRVGVLNRWHRRLFKDWVPLADYAGNMRQFSESMPCLNTDVMFGGRLGTAPRAVPAEMQVLCAEINTRARAIEDGGGAMDDAQLVEAVTGAIARAVADFIRIHPYVNGNGRTSRLLWRAVAARAGFPASVAIGERPEEPYVSCLREAMEGRMGPLVACVLRTISEG